MFPVTITLNNKAELDAVTAAFAALRNKTAIQTEVAQTKPNAEAASKAADKVVAETEKKVEELQKKQEATATTAEQKADDEKTYTLDDAKQLTNKVVAAGKRSEMVALLAEFGVPVSAKLQPEQVNDFCKKAEALL